MGNALQDQLLKAGLVDKNKANRAKSTKHKKMKQQRSNNQLIVDEAKDDARAEGGRMLTAARAEIDQELNRVKEDLRGQVVSIALAGASKVLGREVDETTHAELMDKLAAEI